MKYSTIKKAEKKNYIMNFISTFFFIIKNIFYLNKIRIDF